MSLFKSTWTPPNFFTEEGGNICKNKYSVKLIPYYLETKCYEHGCSRLMVWWHPSNVRAFCEKHSSPSWKADCRDKWAQKRTKAVFEKLPLKLK